VEIRLLETSTHVELISLYPASVAAQRLLFFVWCRLLGRAWESAELPGDPNPFAGLRIHCHLNGSCLLVHPIPAQVKTFLVWNL